jgi:signal peptidase II
MKARRLIWLLVPLCALILDWASKTWILQTLPLGASRTIIPGFFNLTMGFNPGAIFGTLGTAAPWVRTILFTVAGIAAMGYFGWEFLRNGTPVLQRLAMGFILGGAMGNGLDRIQHGAVVDFLDFVFWGWHYWTFNLADSFIVCGAILLGISFLWPQGKPAAD